MQESTLWQAVLGEIELSVSRGSFVTWFKNTRLLRNKDGLVVVGVPNIFVKNQLERKFNDLVVEVLAKNGIQPEKVEYKIHAGINLKPKDPVDDNLMLVNAGGSTTVPKKSSLQNVTHSYRQG